MGDKNPKNAAKASKQKIRTKAMKAAARENSEQKK